MFRLLLRTLAVGRRQHSESIEFELSMEQRGLINRLTLLVGTASCKVSHNLPLCNPPIKLEKLFASLLMALLVGGQHIRAILDLIKKKKKKTFQIFQNDHLEVAACSFQNFDRLGSSGSLGKVCLLLQLLDS